MADVPTDKVQQLRQQGYTNSQVIDILQRDGFSSAQIFDALSHSGIPSGASTMPQAPPPAFNGDLPPPPVFSSPQQPSMPAPPTRQDAPMPQPAPQARAPAAMPSAGMQVSTEEYIESVIDEKWAEIEDDIQKIVEWKNRSEHRLSQLETQLTDVKDRFDKLHAALIGKIETYDKNILEVGAEIKAMEKVFSKVIPTFTDNIKQLSEITEQLDSKTRPSAPSKNRVGQ